MTFKRYLARIVMYLAASVALAMPMLPQSALAIPNYSGSVVAQCVTTSSGITNATATLTTGGWTMAVMTYTFQPGNHTFTGTSGVDPYNNQVAHFSLPPGTYTVYVGTPTPVGTPVGPNSSDIQATYTITVIDCNPQHASLSVRKTVINITGISTGTTVFPVGVSCNHGTVNTTLPLSSANGYQQMVPNLAIGSICSIQEAAVAAPPGCRWVTTYPQGQGVTLTHYASYVLPVQNELVCSNCPPGSIEQIYPGTHVKFCCDHKLDPGSDAFCCKREHSPLNRREDENMSPAKMNEPRQQ